MSMRIVISSTGANLDAAVSPIFGRCPTYLFVDSQTMQFEAVSNPAISAAGGAGIQAAQFVVAQGAEALISGNLGPNAFRVLEAGGVSLYSIAGGTVREAVEAFQAGQLSPAGGATVVAHTGTGQGRRVSPGTPPPVAPAPPVQGEGLSALKDEIGGMKQQLDNLLERLEKLV